MSLAESRWNRGKYYNNFEYRGDVIKNPPPKNPPLPVISKSFSGGLQNETFRHFSGSVVCMVIFKKSTYSLLRSVVKKRNASLY